MDIDEQRRRLICEMVSGRAHDASFEYLEYLPLKRLRPV